MSKFVLRGHIFDASLIWDIGPINEMRVKGGLYDIIHPSFEIRFLNGNSFEVLPTVSVDHTFNGRYTISSSNPKMGEFIKNYEKELEEVRALRSVVSEFWWGVSGSIPVLDLIANDRIMGNSLNVDIDE